MSKNYCRTCATMENVQGYKWQGGMIIKNFGSMCEVCNKYVTPNKLCPKNCDSLLLAWLKQEHEEGEV